jgi:DNA polymerase-3 subunit alpha
VDSVSWGLLFSRFLNANRVSLPDIDVDFAPSGREQLFRYLQERHGVSHVGAISTWSEWRGRSLFLQLWKIFFPCPEDAQQRRRWDEAMDRYRKSIPEPAQGFYTPLEQITSGALFEAAQTKPAIRHLWQTMLRLEGTVHQRGVHPSGVVVSPKPLWDAGCPVRWDDEGKRWVSELDMSDLEAIGLVKMDVLGLDAAQILSECPPLPDTLEHGRAYELFQEGHTSGIFQFGGYGITKALKALAPSEFEDLAAMNALWRPGPIGAGMVEGYTASRHGGAPGPFLELFPETYGWPIYQEQVMRIAIHCAGFSELEADELRRAIGKKKPEEMAKLKDRFVEGWVKWRTRGNGT